MHAGALTNTKPLPTGHLHRPRGYWSHLYLIKQESQPGKVQGQGQLQKQETIASMTALEALGDCSAAYQQNIGRVLHALHPPPAPALFQKDWLRSLLCEGCNLPATANTIKCKHCNIVVHYWCRDGGRDRRRGPRRNAVVNQRKASQWQKQKKLGSETLPLNLVDDWVCWECEEDMVLAMQFFRGVKNQQMGVHREKLAAQKIIRFIEYMAAYNRHQKETKRAIQIQAFIRMRLRFIRFKVWRHAQKRSVVVGVRNAVGLPVGDIVSRKCCPYVVITVIENEADGGQVQTFFHQLPTKKGDVLPPVATPTMATLRDANLARCRSPKGAAASGGGGDKTKQKTQEFQWDEEFFLPGVSDSATIVFTVLHQAPTRLVCLGQAFVKPVELHGTGENVGTVTLATQSVDDSDLLLSDPCQIAIRTPGIRHRRDEPRIDDAQWDKPGLITYVVRKSQLFDSHCGQVSGPIVEEIRTLALVESHNSGTGPGRVSTEKIGSTIDSTRDHLNTRLAVPALGAAGPAAAAATEPVVSHQRHKAIDVSTPWWACMWMGTLRLYKQLGDPHPKLNLALEGWTALPDEEDTMSKPDLRLFNPVTQRRLALRCRSKVDLARWKYVLERNHVDKVHARHETINHQVIYDHIVEGPDKKQNKPDGTGAAGTAGIT